MKLKFWKGKKEPCDLPPRQYKGSEEMRQYWREQKRRQRRKQNG
jgi:hypothetical protein